MPRFQVYQKSQRKEEETGVRESDGENTSIEGQGEVISVNLDVCFDQEFPVTSSLQVVISKTRLSRQEAAFFSESGSESHPNVSVTIADYLPATSFNGYSEDFDISDINLKLLCKSVSRVLLWSVLKA